MTHDILLTVPRSERRRLLDGEARARRTGQWGEWEKLDLLTGVPGSNGWAREVKAVYRNAVFSVLERDAGGGVTHYSVSSLSQERPTWWEMQRIKDEISGPDTTAVEVYPPKEEVVDEADMYHFWVLPVALPFSLYPRQTPGKE